MKVAAILAVLLARLSSCVSIFCPLAVSEEPQRIGVARDSVEDVLPRSRDEFVVAALTHPTGMIVSRLEGGAETSVASTPALFPYASASLFATTRGWWFSRQGDEGTVSSAFFVASEEGTLHEKRVSLPRREASAWLPLPGAEPRGIYVSVRGSPRHVQFHDVRPAGTKLLAEIPWNETGPERTLVNSRWSAEVLPDGRVAVVTTDEAGAEGTIRLHLLGGANAHLTLPCTDPIDHPIETAVDDAGRLAIVGLAKDRRVVAALANVDQPQSSRCRVISVAEEVAAQPPFGTPAIGWSGEAFLAAWIRDDGTVRAAELRRLNAAPLVVDIGHDANVDRPLRQLLHHRGDEVVFVWRARHGEIVQRWLPNAVVGHAVMTDALERLCKNRKTQLTQSDRARD